MRRHLDNHVMFLEGCIQGVRVVQSADGLLDVVGDMHLRFLRGRHPQRRKPQLGPARARSWPKILHCQQLPPLFVLTSMRIAFLATTDTRFVLH